MGQVLEELQLCTCSGACYGVIEAPDQLTAFLHTQFQCSEYKLQCAFVKFSQVWCEKLSMKKLKSKTVSYTVPGVVAAVVKLMCQCRMEAHHDY